MRTVLPLLATKTLSPAGAALARRVLATGAMGPGDAGPDPVLAGARASALLAQGDPKAAAAILLRAPGIDRTPELARAAAESALLAGDDTRACAVAEGLSAGRDETYWLRLRTYCQAIAGHAGQAQLTFDLAQSQAKDAVFGRLMAAKLAGSGDPGPASLRNGLDYALSHSLGLDLAAAKAAPAVAAAISGDGPAEAALRRRCGLAGGEPAHRRPRPKRRARARRGPGPRSWKPPPPPSPRPAPGGRPAPLLALALRGPLDSEGRGQLAALAAPEGKAPLGRNLALDAAGDQKLMGEAAMLALWTCAEAGPAGPAIGDRVRIVRALHLVGLETDARAFALEGLIALK